MQTRGITAAFNDYFQIIFADTPELRDEVYRLRYQVYCKELGYEPADAFPDGLEKDDFDERSRHCLLWHRSSENYAGCIRLVLPDPANPEAGLPFESSCIGNLYPEVTESLFTHRQSLGEYSRLAVPESFRRRSTDRGKPLGSLEDPVPRPGGMRQFQHIPFGLYLAGVAVAVASGLEGVIAMMEPRLARHLQRFGMVYEQVGEIVDHHGPRAPFYCNRSTLFEHLHPEIRKMLDDLLAEVKAA